MYTFYSQMLVFSQSTRQSKIYYLVCRLVFPLNAALALPWKPRVLTRAQLECAQRVTLGTSNILTP